LERAGALVGMVATGAVKAPIRQSWPLEEAGSAHQALENRQTQGMTVLTL